MRGETRQQQRLQVHCSISIHSPRARGDEQREQGRAEGAISIRSPHARGDPSSPRICSIRFYFNPLPSCEGRHGPTPERRAGAHFNPLPSCEGRPSREGRRDDRKSILDIINFNPLPSCEGRLNSVLPRITRCAFQSTPLMRGETPWAIQNHRG